MTAQLSTAFEFESFSNENEITTQITQVVEIIPSKGFAFTITESKCEPKTVSFKQFTSTPDRMLSHMRSLTDDLIWNQWFKSKEHKKKK